MRDYVYFGFHSERYQQYKYKYPHEEVEIREEQEVLCLAVR
jgi:hypothetical protein